MPQESYANYPSIKFNDDGFIDVTGRYILYIIDENTGVKSFESDENTIYCDMSDIDNVMFRENYLMFINGLYQADAQIMTSINNITLCDNPSNNKYNIICIYNKQSAHVIRNSDVFLKSYMNEKAKTYLEVLFYSNYEKYTALDAYDFDDNLLYKNIDAYILDMEVAFVPSLTDYIVYINDHNTDAVEIVKKAIEPLDFEFNPSKIYEDNISEALDKIVDYNPMLLTGLYHTFIDSKMFTGKQANESLMFQFMYENKRGLKIPRKRYRDHETYVMVFLNGELYDRYYLMIAYANFFFIPVEEGFEFEDTDRLEVLYFKNVNNNEIQFTFTEWIYKTLTYNTQNISFYDISIFKQFIKPDELKIFSHYPQYMLKYPTLIKEPSNDIAFNVSYRDDNNNLCIKNTAIMHLIDNYTSIYGVDMDSGAFYDDFSGIDMDNSNPLFVSSDGIIVGDVITGESIPYDYNLDKLQSMFVATSKHKFIYQRLYVDQKAYRIEIHKRFRYCDNQRQYLLFINGRRMKQDSFLVTIPKHTRPFTGLYLYTARFVNPDDRIELFYLPYEMTDINIDNNPRNELKESGYLDYDKTDINAPLSKELYLFFINGKKIPYDDIIDVDSHTIRVTVNTNTLKYPAITAINVDEIPKVTEYLMDQNRYSKHDALVNYIKTRVRNGYDELDKAFGNYTKMTDGEEDKIWADVAHIAILNEIVRDWWVTSGYPYQEQLFVYDYEEDELYEQMVDGTLILPALDANPKINIEKNEVSLLYFYSDSKDLLFEIGDQCNSFKLYWEYSQRLNQDLMILSQSINGIPIDINDREYEWVENISKTTNYKFEANTGQQYLIKNITLDFVNGIYWGLLDEDQLQYYELKRNVVWLDDIIALIPKNGIIPGLKEQELESGNYELRGKIEEENYIIRGISYDKESAIQINIWDDLPTEVYDIALDNIDAILEDGSVYKDIFARVIRERYINHTQIMDVYGGEEIFAVTNDGRVIHDIFGQLIYWDQMKNLNVVDVYNDDIYAILDDGTKWDNLFYQMVDHPVDNPELYNDRNVNRWKSNGYETIEKNPMNTIREYYDVADLHQMLDHLDKHLLRSADIKLNDYIIGNNKYFVFTCPKRLVYNGSKSNNVEFFFPELDSEDILANCRDDKTTPLYTNGRYDKLTKSLHKLYKMQMDYMGEFKYTNKFGYTEPYLMWKTNGFFTRLFENYGMDIHIKIGDYSEVGYGFDSNSSSNTINYNTNSLFGSTTPRRFLRNASVDSMSAANNPEEETDMTNTTTKTINKTINVGGTKVVGETKTIPADKTNVEPMNIEILGDSKVSDKQFREMLDKGIFLI